jgi:hypothetical protein
MQEEEASGMVRNVPINNTYLWKRVNECMIWGKYGVE